MITQKEVLDGFIRISLASGDLAREVLRDTFFDAFRRTGITTRKLDMLLTSYMAMGEAVYRAKQNITKAELNILSPRVRFLSAILDVPATEFFNAASLNSLFMEMVTDSHIVIQRLFSGEPAFVSPSSRMYVEFLLDNEHHLVQGIDYTVGAPDLGSHVPPNTKVFFLKDFATAEYRAFWGNELFNPNTYVI